MCVWHWKYSIAKELQLIVKRDLVEEQQFGISQLKVIADK